MKAPALRLSVAASLLLALATVAAGELTAVDDLGNTVILEAAPLRLVSLAPSNTEILFAMGLGERVVGVTKFCNYPPATAGITPVAGYSDLSVETVLTVEPDLVVAARGNDIEGLESLRQLAVPVFALDVQSIDQLLNAIERLGRLTGADSSAAALAADLSRRAEAVRQRVSAVERRPRVMWASVQEPIYTAGAHTIIDDVLTRAGGDNLGRRADTPWPQVSLETVVDWQPEVIVTTYMAGGADAVGAAIEQLQGLSGWKELPAVKTGRVHYVEADWLSRPGPRLIDALEQVAELICP